MRRVVLNQKGGVGKSSIACNLAAVSTAEGYRTLLVDLDAQANSTHYDRTDRRGPAGGDRRLLQADLVFRALQQEGQVEIYETPFDNLQCVTSSPELADLQPKLESKHKINKLRKLLDELDEDYDRIYLDTPPALNFYHGICADRCRSLPIPSIATASTTPGAVWPSPGDRGTARRPQRRPAGRGHRGQPVPAAPACRSNCSTSWWRNCRCCRCT
ncbi:ParA family protein [Pseudomonas aeruginosa]|nr:ParA family protein [Pseudomonas aeruginosa]